MLLESGFKRPHLTNLQTLSTLLYLRSFATSVVNKTSFSVSCVISMRSTSKHTPTQGNTKLHYCMHYCLFFVNKYFQHPHKLLCVAYCVMM